jgi:hypothetical protein
MDKAKMRELEKKRQRGWLVIVIYSTQKTW